MVGIVSHGQTATVVGYLPSYRFSASSEIEYCKLTLGVPFYGYDFVSSSLANAVTYAQMVTSNPAYADLDTVGNIYYNGRPSIESKVNLANNEVSGIMIWEIGQDSFDEFYIDVSKFQKGLYFIKIVGKDEVPQVHKIIVI